jgi:hypothetical protein
VDRHPDQDVAGDIAIAYADALGWGFALDTGGDGGMEAECFVDEAVEEGDERGIRGVFDGEKIFVASYGVDGALEFAVLRGIFEEFVEKPG